MRGTARMRNCSLHYAELCLAKGSVDISNMTARSKGYSVPFLEYEEPSSLGVSAQPQYQHGNCRLGSASGVYFSMGELNLALTTTKQTAF